MPHGEIRVSHETYGFKFEIDVLSCSRYKPMRYICLKKVSILRICTHSTRGPCNVFHVKLFCNAFS